MVIVLFRILVKVMVVTPQAGSDCSKATVFKGPFLVAGKTVIVSVVVEKKRVIVVVGSSEFAKLFPLTTPSGAGGAVAAGF